MYSLNSLVRWFSRIFLHLSIFILIASFCFIFLIGDKQIVKDSIYESGIYNEYVNSIIETNIEASKDKEGTLPLDDPEIQKIVAATNALVGAYGSTLNTAIPLNYRQGNDMAMANFIKEAGAGQIGAVVFYNS